MGDLVKALEGSDDDVKARLTAMSPETLKQLHALESDGQKRAGVLTAIEAALASQSSADDLEHGDRPVFTQAQMDEALAQQKVTLDAERERAVADAKGKAVPKAPAKPKPAKPLVIEAKGASEPYHALTSGGSVVFVDDHHVPLAALPPMTFAADAFEPAGDNAVKLRRDVNFPNTLVKGEISAAFLLDDEEEPCALARLVAPFAIGGGRDARLGAGALMFAKE